MSWLNLNESLNNIKGQISSFASGVLADGIVHDTDPFTELSIAQQKVLELQNLCASQEVEVTSLRRQNAELLEKSSAGHMSKNGPSSNEENNWFWDPPTSDDSKKQNNTTISDLSQRVQQLELEKQELVQNLEQLDQDCQRTTDKLIILKDNLQTDYNTLKNEYDSLKIENESVTEDNKKFKLELKKLADEITKLKCSKGSDTVPPSQSQSQSQIDDETKIAEEKKIDELNTRLTESSQQLERVNAELDKMRLDTIPLDKHKMQVKMLNEKYQIAEKNYEKLASEIAQKETHTMQNCNLSDDHKKIQDLYDELQLKHAELVGEKQEMHRKYVNILTETVEKYVNYSIPDEFVQKQNESVEISEFSSKVEAVLKLLLDFQWKTETLERKLCEITNERAAAITEKNHEIEKLLHNSEILSQEVITKTQTIKHYEMECSELIKNNDLLIAELQQYKNNNGLQTISESNEDNLLLLETQLENANKRIRELELVINDMENSKQDVALETQTELDYIKKQLNMTGRELSQSKKEYQELTKKTKHFETDNKNLKAEVVRLKSLYDTHVIEVQNLEAVIDKLKSNVENSEYIFNEVNMDLDTVKEDYKKLQMERTNLSNTNEHVLFVNKELENKLATVQSQIDTLQMQLNSIETEKNDLDQRYKELTEKYQNSKITETKLKLENDTFKRERDAFNELKSILDQKTFEYNGTIERVSKIFDNLINNTTVILNHPRTTVVEQLSLEEKIDALTKINVDIIEHCQTLENKWKTTEDELQLLKQKNNINNEQQQHNAKTDSSDALTLAQLQEQLAKSNALVDEMRNRITQLEGELTVLNKFKCELETLVTAKHQESLQYHSEIQRLNQILSVENEKYRSLEQQLTSIQQTVDRNVEIDKLTEQNNFLREKCEKLAHNLLEEQSNSKHIHAEKQIAVEREQTLTKEIDRLRLHLVEIEDSYTKELLQAEQKNQEMLTKVNEIEQRERDSSTIYTSVSIRANQQVETLQNQLHLVTVQRDDLQKKISEAEDKNNKQFAALTNLQCVLEQFQRDREKDILGETERIRRQISIEVQKQNELKDEINLLKSQLDESKQGLKAAARLTEQMEKSNQQVVQMKDEVSKLQEQVRKSEEKYTELSTRTNATVDKSLIKNLVIGFVSSNKNLNKDQKQILKIIATVLDFTSQDNEKLDVNKPVAGGSWLSAILHPQTMAPNAELSQQSLSEAFVRFLENESQPKPVPPPLINVRKMSTESNASNSSSSTANTRHTPILLNEVVLPTFADFAQNRNSSSILKDVLKEN